eukprot:m.83448 g.83448  ORF g.83448 m.83448 type:complete len:475 (-) comp8689_c1_seq1:162-1586(-)
MDVKLFLKETLKEEEEVTIPSQHKGNVFDAHAKDDGVDLARTKDSLFNFDGSYKSDAIFHQRQKSFDAQTGHSANWSVSSWDGHSQQASITSLDDFSLLPSGWSVGKTPEGRVYFIDELNKVTTWLDPRTARPYPGSCTQPGQLGVEKDDVADLPKGWEIVYTPDDHPYFVNHFDHTTTWEDPRGNRSRAFHSQCNSEDSTSMNTRLKQLDIRRNSNPSTSLRRQPPASSYCSCPDCHSKGTPMYLAPPTSTSMSGSSHGRSYSQIQYSEQSFELKHMRPENPYLQAATQQSSSPQNRQFQSQNPSNFSHNSPQPHRQYYSDMTGLYRENFSKGYHSPNSYNSREYIKPETQQYSFEESRSFTNSMGQLADSKYNSMHMSNGALEEDISSSPNNYNPSHPFGQAHKPILRVDETYTNMNDGHLQTMSGPATDAFAEFCEEGDNRPTTPTFFNLDCGDMDELDDMIFEEEFGSFI